MRLVAFLAERADDDQFDLTAAAFSFRCRRAIWVSAVSVLIEDDNQQSVASGLKVRALNQRFDLGFQPGIECIDGAIVRIIASVGHQPGESGQSAMRQILGESTEANVMAFLFVDCGRTWNGYFGMMIRNILALSGQLG